MLVKGVLYVICTLAGSSDVTTSSVNPSLNTMNTLNTVESGLTPQMTPRLVTRRKSFDAAVIETDIIKKPTTPEPVVPQVAKDSVPELANVDSLDSHIDLFLREQERKLKQPAADFEAIDDLENMSEEEVGIDPSIATVK